MRVSTRSRYSLRLMMEIARFSDEDVPVGLQDVATWTGLSRRYLEQLVIPLRGAGLLRAKPGRKGGYSLNRDPASIPLGEILTAASGPFTLVECTDDAGTCKRSGRCECRLLWVLLTRRIREVLDEYSLADLVDPAWRAAVSARIEKPERRRSTRREDGKQ